MSFKVRVKGAFPHAFVVHNVPIGALVEDVAAFVEASESGKAVGFKMATWDLFLLDAVGTKHTLDPEAAFPAVPGNPAPPAAGSTVNVWIEIPAAGGTAAAAAGGAPAAGGGGGGGGAQAAGAHPAREVRFVSSPAITLHAAHITLTAMADAPGGLKGARRFVVETASELQVGGSVKRTSPSVVQVDAFTVEKKALLTFVRRLQQHFVVLAEVVVVLTEVVGATMEELRRTVTFVYVPTSTRIAAAAADDGIDVSGDDSSDLSFPEGAAAGGWLHIEVRSRATSAFDNLIRVARGGGGGGGEDGAAGGAGGGCATGR